MKLSHSPRLWARDLHGHRRVTWLELFFDLIFVAAVAQVGQPLTRDYTATGLVRHAFLFVLVWSAWSGHTAFVTRFDHDDPVSRILLLVQCFVAAVMAANAKEALDSVSAAGFGAAYAGMRIVLVVQYLRARSVAETRELTTRYAAGFGVAAIVWFVSALLDAPARYWIWALAFGIDFATPWLAAKHVVRFPPDASHYPERFGLFTIILLGEFVACVMRGIESQENWSLPAATTAFCGMAFAFLLRWWYFDVARGADERHIRSLRQARWFHVWQYVHLPLFLGVAIAGVGFERLISHQDGGWILCTAAGVSTTALAWIGATRDRIHRRLWAQVAMSMGTIGFGIAAPHIDRVVLSLYLLATCGAQAVLGVQAPPAAVRRAA
jgi:low temperature requirement protein LtrA